MAPRKKNGSMDWEEIYGKGENPNGMMAQTADETVRNCEALPPQDYHYHQNADGPRWNGGFQEPPFEGPASMPSVVVVKRKKR